MLKKLREVRDAEPENDSGLREEELSRDRHGVLSSNLPARTRLAASNDSIGGVGQRFQQEEVQMRHESRDVHGKITSQKNDDPLEYTRGNLARFNGVSTASDNKPSPSSIGAVQAKTKRLGEVALGGVGAAKPGGRFDGITDAIDNAPRLSGSAIRNDRLNTDTSRNIYVTRSGRPETEDNVRRLTDSLRRPVTIPTALVEKDNDGFASGGKAEDVGRAVERGERSGYRDYARENIREKSGRETVKPRLVEHNDVRTKPVASGETFESGTSSHRKESVQDAVGKRKGLSVRTRATKDDSHGLLRKSRSLAQEETSSSKEGVLDKRTEKDHKESEGNVRARERKTRDAMGLSPSKTSRGGGPSQSGNGGHKTTKEGGTLFPAKSRSRVNKCGRSSKDIDGHGGGKKGKENMRPQGVARDQKETRGENVDKKGRTRETVTRSRKEVESDSVDERSEGTEASQIGVYFFSVDRKFRLKAFLKLRRLRLMTGKLDDAVSRCKNQKNVLINVINI